LVNLSKIFSVNFLLWWAPFGCGPLSIAYSACTIATALQKKSERSWESIAWKLREFSGKNLKNNNNLEIVTGPAGGGLNELQKYSK
jgi:hypothetical protein